jgi:hypothetical protein
MLPHMSVLPTGVDVQITPFHDSVLGQAALRVQRPAFRPGGEAKQIEFRDTLPRKPGFPTLQDAANGVFGSPQSGRNWIFPVGYVGLAKLAQSASAHNRAVDLETLATDFWCLVRPQAVERIRKYGRGLHSRHHSDQRGWEDRSQWHICRPGGVALQSGGGPAHHGCGERAVPLHGGQ